MANTNIPKGSEILAGELATSISRYDFAIQIAKLASYEKRFINNYNYPIIGTPTIINGRPIKGKKVSILNNGRSIIILVNHKPN